MAKNLATKSIEIILQNQEASGAYIASPNFATYHYCWIRDGSYIADAMDLVGEHESAAKFHDWVKKIILDREELIKNAITKLRTGQNLKPSETLHTRYTLEGLEGSEEEWPNFQNDGFGTWLWALARAIKSGLTAEEELLHAADLVAAYLGAIWQRPCYDSWEEFPDHMHTYTLACIYAGLRDWRQFRHGENCETAQRIKAFVLENLVVEGAFIKSSGMKVVDGNLLPVSLLYDLVPLEDKRFLKTVERIRHDLEWRNGLHRYAGDTYYGGGSWILISSWMGQVLAKLGRPEAKDYLYWIEKQASSCGYLPEQVLEHVNHPSCIAEWQARWGAVAEPLLWSHANYLVLESMLKR